MIASALRTLTSFVMGWVSSGVAVGKMPKEYALVCLAAFCVYAVVPLFERRSV